MNKKQEIMKKWDSYFANYLLEKIDRNEDGEFIKSQFKLFLSSAIDEAVKERDDTAYAKGIIEGIRQERERVRKMIIGMDIKKHICRFNDGDQFCDCYIAGRNDILSQLK